MTKIKPLRKKALLVFFTDEEREYLARAAKDCGYSRATLIRLRTFGPGWRAELKRLRVKGT